MVLTAEPITLDSIDKSTWKTYRFDQIAKNISERVEPIETDLEIYVGLEHIDSDSIHIKRFGKREDVSGTKLRCYPGDVIFGRRRAYQRKAAIVTFDGFCSAHSLVLRANPNVILPELFPFFLHSDTFMHRAVDISVGSLSPTINWGDLKKQEFLLPPKDQQVQIAELLWAGDEYLNKLKELYKRSVAFEKLKSDDLITKSSATYKRLSDLVQKKISYGIVQAGPHIEGGTPYIKSSDLSEYGIAVSTLQCTSDDIAKKYRRSEVEPGDIVFSLRGNLGQMCIVPKILPVANLTQGTARISVNQEHHAHYIKLALEITSVQKKINASSKGSTFKEISLEALRAIEVPVPKTLQEQKQISSIIESIRETRQIVKRSIQDRFVLQKSLINQFF